MIACICGGTVEIWLCCLGLGVIAKLFHKKHKKEKCDCCKEHKEKEEKNESNKNDNQRHI